MADGEDGAVGEMEDEARKENVAVTNNYEEAKRSIEQYEISTTTKFYCYKKDKAFLNEGRFYLGTMVGWFGWLSLHGLKTTNQSPSIFIWQLTGRGFYS